MSGSDTISKRGRPPKADALSPAERAKRYRAKKALQSVAVRGAVPNDKPVDDLMSRLVALQRKYDLEHHANVLLTNEVATLRQAVQAQPRNSDKSEITAMRKTIVELEKIISAYSAEINRLHNEFK